MALVTVAEQPETASVTDTDPDPGVVHVTVI